MKKTLFVVLVLLVCAGLLYVQLPTGRPSTAATLVGTYEVEPNNTFAEANPVALPVNMTGSINPISDTDFYSLTTQSGNTYRTYLSISSAEDLVLRIRIYDADQNLQGASYCSSTLIEHTWTTYTPGTYLQIQEVDPTTSTTKTAGYRLEVDWRSGFRHFIYFPWVAGSGN